MQSITALATLLIVLSWAPVSSADTAVLDPQPEMASAVVVAKPRPTATEDSSIARLPEPAARRDDWLTEKLQTLSPFPVLALGILGLFWIRRHTAEL